MFKELFDTYNIRARLSVYVILIAPIIASVYVLYEPIRNIGASAILIIILAAFSNYFLILLRHLVRHHYYSDTAALFLQSDDTHIDAQTKDRYYSILSSFNDSFDLMDSDKTEDDIKAICADITLWLRNKTRDNRLIQEENTLYGFINNLLNLKPLGLIITVLSVILQLIFIMPDISLTPTLLEDPQNLFLLIMDLFFILFWTAGVSLRICKSAAEKYAYALLGSIDNISYNQGH